MTLNTPAPMDGLHPRPLDRFPELAHLAADLLRKPPALLGLTDAEARCVVGHMQLFDFAKGSLLLRECDSTATGYMLLVLNGEVSVEITEPGKPGDRKSVV